MVFVHARKDTGKTAEKLVCFHLNKKYLFMGCYRFSVDFVMPICVIHEDY